MVPVVMAARGWEQIGSSGSLPTALNGVQRLSAAPNCIVFLQVVCVVAGQRVVVRPFSHRRGHWFDPSIAHKFPQVSCMSADLVHRGFSIYGELSAPTVRIPSGAARYGFRGGDR